MTQNGSEVAYIQHMLDECTSQEKHFQLQSGFNLAH